MSTEPERAEPVLSPEDRPPALSDREREHWHQVASEANGLDRYLFPPEVVLAALDEVAALRARLDAAAEVERTMLRVAAQPTATAWEKGYEHAAHLFSDRLHAALTAPPAAALGGSDSPTGPGQD